MKVLIADFDLFNKIGGGQTYYRSIIEKNPNISFYYLTILESVDQVRPVNAYVIPYKERYFVGNLGSFYDVNPPQWIYRAFVMATNIAASVAGHQFDVVDLPDYEQFGTLLEPALRHYKVDFEKIVLSMHGRISTSIQLNWSSDGKIDKTLNLQEKMQYSTVDVRYGISKAYLDEWRTLVNLESHYLNPLWFISLPKPTLASYSSEPPSINFIGRTEKRKGPDIFVDLAWWLPRSSFSTANIIGPDSYDYKGIGSGLYLYTMANNRFKDINVLPAMSQSELSQLFASKSMTLLPSRYDTLNLVAIESLFSGCPTAIGSGAGVCRLLTEVFPNVPFVTIDTTNIYSSINSIYSVLQNYEDYRKQLVEALLNTDPQVNGDSLEEIYNSTPVYDKAIRNELQQWYSQLINYYDYFKTVAWKPTLKKIALTQLPPTLLQKLHTYKSNLSWNSLKSTIKTKVVASRISNDLRIADQVLKARSLVSKYRDIFNASEQTEETLSNKVKQCWGVASDFRIDRVRIWREIARLEHLRGNELTAATYQLRAMRSLGHDRFGDLVSVTRTLEAYGFTREASAAEAMYGKHTDSAERCMELLNQALLNNKFKQTWEYEFLDDRRELPAYRVSIIVSLYNAAAKLPLFLTALQNQTLIKAGEAEVILIDSGSPADEYAVFQQLAVSLNIPIVYARSAKRETIQSAWNRGIALSRSPYLAFLGVDETLLPDCLEVLAAELDADPTLDWVQGNSLVTNVDKSGTWVNDIMIYDRTGYKQDLVYLETCYLSWVGALYRRSIHDRFGFYDSTFTAAGDTEFKNRVLPFIKTKSIPRTLGVFLNYPDERTTQHPRAEIEDLRAWYLHRTIGGVTYAFSRRDPNEAEDLLYASLRYRKSYCQHWSTDVEYAYNVGTFLQEKVQNSPALKYLDGIRKVLHAYRSWDWIQPLSTRRVIYDSTRTERIATKVEQHHRALDGQKVDPFYKILNDNRHEQHSYLWFTDV